MRSATATTCNYAFLARDQQHRRADAVPGGVARPGSHVLRAGGLGHQLRSVQKMERRSERHARVRVQDRTRQRSVAVHR